MRGTVFAALTIALFAAGDVALADQAATPAEISGGQNDLDQIVCKKGEPLVGSRLPGPRVCKTKRDWEAEAQQAKDFTNGTQMKGLRSCPQTAGAQGCGG